MVKNPPANAGDMDSIPRSERFPGGGNGNPLQFSCQENPTNRGAWQAKVHGVTESDMTEHAHTQTHTYVSSLTDISITVLLSRSVWC